MRYTTEQHERALEQLREWLKPGATVFTIVRHVSRSGMSRSISVFASVDGQPHDITYQASRVMGESVDQKHGGIRMGGCGMDMGFALVYSLSRRLYPDGFGCIGKGDGEPRNYCPSSDHNNGDRDYTPHRGPAGNGENPPDRWDDCGQCGGAHAPDFTGDCRDDAHRWPPTRPHWHGDGGYALRHRWM